MKSCSQRYWCFAVALLRDDLIDVAWICDNASSEIGARYMSVNRFEDVNLLQEVYVDVDEEGRI